MTGLTGRTLTVPTEWSESNVNGKKFRVGCKKIFSLYPKVLKDQVHKHRLDKLWSTSHKQNLAKVTNDIEAFEVRNVWIFFSSHAVHGYLYYIDGYKKWNRSSQTTEINIKATAPKKCN